MRGFEVVDGGGGEGGGEVIICMVGLVLVMEWTSVLVIILRIPKKTKEKQTNKIQEDKEGEPRNKRSQYKIRCIIVLIVLKTN